MRSNVKYGIEHIIILSQKYNVILSSFLIRNLNSPHPVGQNWLPPPNHSRACSRCPPWPQPGHHTNIPLTGSWHMKQNPILLRQLPHALWVVTVTVSFERWSTSRVIVTPGNNLPQLGHDSWNLSDDAQDFKQQRLQEKLIIFERGFVNINHKLLQKENE